MPAAGPRGAKSFGDAAVGDDNGDAVFHSGVAPLFCSISNPIVPALYLPSNIPNLRHRDALTKEMTSGAT